MRLTATLLPQRTPPGRNLLATVSLWDERMRQPPGTLAFRHCITAEPAPQLSASAATTTTTKGLTTAGGVAAVGGVAVAGGVVAAAGAAGGTIAAAAGPDHGEPVLTVRIWLCTHKYVARCCIAGYQALLAHAMIGPVQRCRDQYILHTQYINIVNICAASAHQPRGADVCPGSHASHSCCCSLSMCRLRDVLPLSM